MNEARESVAITHSATFPICHSDSNPGGRFRSSRREASLSPQQIADYVQGPSEGPIRHSRLNEVVYGNKISKLFTKGEKWDLLGEMITPAVYPNPKGSAAIVLYYIYIYIYIYTPYYSNIRSTLYTFLSR
jgi:hypothetical protein